MKNSNIYNLSDWPFKQYHHVSDLIDFEGPLLVHYSYNEKHALYYWVEGGTEYNTWLCFDVKLVDLYDYLYQNITLFELLKQKAHDIFFLVDIDEKFEYHNYRLVYGHTIPQDYMPDVESYYTYDVPVFYQKLFTSLKNDEYIEVLRRRSLELIIKPNSASYGDTVSVEEAGQFLLNVNSSYKSFGACEFYNKFKGSFSNLDELAKTTKKLTNSLDPRITNSRQSSFHVSITTDVLVNGDIKQEYAEFKRQLSKQYEDEVLNIDLNKEEDIAKITEKYDEYSRKQIFEPLIKIINNPKYDFSVINKAENSTKTFNKINHLNKQKIVPKTPKNEPSKELKKVLVTITLELNENTDIATISKKDIAEGTLFSKISQDAQQEIQKIESDRYTIILINPIYINYKLENGVYEITFDQLEIKIKNAVRNVAFENFVDEFISIVERDYIAKKPFDKDKQKYLQSVIKDIIEKDNA
jgi:hypothetical protein